MFDIEKELLDQGHRYVIGIDEAGRGPLAGDVVAAAVCIDLEKPIEGIKDSKKLSEKKREEMAAIISKEALDISISGAPVEVIDKINIKNATIKSMENALVDLLEKLKDKNIEPSIVLVDSEHISSPMETMAIDKGDDLTMAIGAASIIAKVYRDNLCKKWDQEYPKYGFAKHKGYGTKDHRIALVRYGPSPIHRKSFMKNLNKWKEDSYSLGGLGETIAGETMEEKGYTILERNYELKSGEIDIICQKEDIIAFVEVKLRKNHKYGHGYEYVSDKQKSRIKNSAKMYVVKKNLQGYQFRFDIIEVYTENGQVVIYEDAFN